MKMEITTFLEIETDGFPFHYITVTTITHHSNTVHSLRYLVCCPAGKLGMPAQAWVYAWLGNVT